MPGSSNSVDDDDNVAKLMPNVAKLIRAESNPLESNGSTSMSLCGISGKEKSETQSAKPSRQQRAEAVFRDVANKFLRRGAAGKRSVGACKPSSFDTLSANYSSSAERRNAYVFEKENLRPKASTLVKQGALPIFQQRMTIRDTSQKGARGFKKKTTRSVVKLGQRRTVNPKIHEADKSNTDTVPEHITKDAATDILSKASHSSRGSEGSCYNSNLAAKSRRGKAKPCRKTIPSNFRELQEKFAELDGEALEEEEVSIAQLATKRPVLASETVLQRTEHIQANVVGTQKDLSRRKDEVSATNLNPNVDQPTLPKCSHGQGQEGFGVCTSQSKLSRTPNCRGQDVQVSEPTSKGNTREYVAASAGTNCNAMITPSEIKPSPSGCLNLDGPKVNLPKAFFSSEGSKRSSQISSDVAAQQQLGVKLRSIVTLVEISELQYMYADEVNIEMKKGWSAHPTLLSGVVSQRPYGDERDNVKCRIKENSALFEQNPAGHSVNGIEDKTSSSKQLIHVYSARDGAHGRTAHDTKPFPTSHDASAQELVGKGTRFELEHAQGSCNDKGGNSSLQPNVDNFKDLTAQTVHDGAAANASHHEDTVLSHTSTSRENVQTAPSKAKCPLEQEGVPDIPLPGGIYSTRDTSATPPRNPLLLTCLHYSRIGRSIDTSQRRLVFDSPSESLPRQKAVDSNNSEDGSVSTVEFKGKTDLGTDILNPEVQDFEANITTITHPEAKLLFADDEVGDRGCTSQSSGPKVASHCEGVVEGEIPSTVSVAQDDDLPAFETSRGVVIKDPAVDSLSPQAGPTEIPKARGFGKRTWANLGDPIDGGTEWKKGRRVSTRIKSRPLDWWRGERMLYGRVHSNKATDKALCTLIGIKTTSPDPTWPRPKPHREDYNKRNFHVDSFVGDRHRDLLRLAAQ